MRSIYLDLFDDNLYEFTPDGPRQPEDLHAVLSVQVLLSILFRRRIAVPEQWLCSSRAFVLLARSVIQAWHDANGLALQRGRTALPFPFAFSYFPRDARGTEFLAAQAIRERLLRQRPLRLAQALSLETPEEQRLPARQSLQDALSDALSDNIPNFGGTFVDKVGRATGDPIIAEALGSILGHIASARPLQTVRSLDNYNQELSAAVRSVRNALRMEALRELGDPRTDGFIEFFNEVRDRKIPLHDITGMWGVTRNYDPSLRNTVTLMGRYCLHRAMGRWTSADWSAASYSLFSNEHPDGYDHKLLATARKAEWLKQTQAAAQHDFDQLIVDAAADYPHAASLAANADLMETLWRRAFDMAESTQWSTVVKKTRARLMREKDSKMHSTIIKETMLDTLLATFAELVFARDPGGEALFCAQFPILGSDPSRVSKAFSQFVVPTTAAAGSAALGLPVINVIVVTAAATCISEMLGIHPKVGGPRMTLWLSATERRIRQLWEDRG
ncbi:MAG: hypothetical protein AMXMBFR59_41550 [Rhodanobacteraceae bacterium]